MSKKLFVANLPYEIKEENLVDLFGLYGDITYTKILKDKKNGRSKGFGFIEFKNTEDADNAIKDMNKRIVINRIIVVREAL